MPRSNRPRRLPTLAIGFALGVVVGSSGLAAAAFGRQGWERFGPMFKQGYVAGFLECVRIAKALDPFSYVATQFPAPPKAKPDVWMRKIDELYAMDEHKNRTLPQLLIIAGGKLEKDYGLGDVKPGDRRLEALRQAIDRQRKALLQARKTVQAAEGEQKKEGEKSAGAANGNAASAATQAPTPESANDGGAKPPEAQADGAKPDDAIKRPQADPDAPNKDEHEQEE
jgi:hypothetical protein